MLQDVAAISRIVNGRTTGAWHPRAHFTMHRLLTVQCVRVHLTAGVHVAPPGAGYPTYRAIVGLNPVGRRLPKSGWHPKLLKLDWYKKCEQFLTRYRYRGDWYQTPYGRVGDFERRVTTREALVGELDVLEQLCADKWPLTR
jgi:hypothetical protein